MATMKAKRVTKVDMIASIEAGPVFCGDCGMLRDQLMRGAKCGIFGQIYVRDEDKPYLYIRLPACVRAESHLTRLVEVAREARRWANNRSENWAIGLVEQIDAALAPFKEKK